MAEVAHGDFFRVEAPNGDVLWYQCNDFTLAEVSSLNAEVTVETGFFVRFVNLETWEGPFDSEEEALTFLEEVGE